MLYITWVNENDRPRILDVLDKVFASTGETQQHNYEEFKKIVGRVQAEAAIQCYLRAQKLAA
jgi:hypothetical protein